MNEMNWNKLCLFANNFHLDIEVFKSLETFAKSLDEIFFEETLKKVTNNFSFDEILANFKTQKEQEQFLLLCIVGNFEVLKNHYQNNNYPKKMFEEILYDLNYWVELHKKECGYIGLSNRIFIWSVAVLKGEVKQFGRLQSNMFHLFLQEVSLYKDENGKLVVLPWNNPNNPPNPLLSYQDKCINLHIPGGKSLDVKECVNSIKEMIKFSQKYTPDYDYKAIVCYSWLLDNQFQQILEESSNILQFQKLGHNFIDFTMEQTNEVKWRIWGEKGKKSPLEELPVTTNMQKGVMNFLQNGGVFHEGVMIIFKDEIEKLLKNHTDIS